MNLGCASAILDHVLRGLALNRHPGWNFPGNFLQLSFDEIEPGRSTLSLATGPHTSTSEDSLELAAIAVLADTGMAAALRKQMGRAARMATVQMSLSFTDAPVTGLVEAISTAEGLISGTAAPQLYTRTSIQSGGQVCCTGSASFLFLGEKPDLAAMRMARRGAPGFDAPPLAAAELDHSEAAVLERARQTLAAGPEDFLARFWGMVPQAGVHAASCELQNGLHVGNRVGHTQGGIVLALAAHTCRAAAGEEWALASISGWYLAPGRGPALRATAAVIHRGSSTAACTCEIRDEEGRLIMHAASSHVRRAQA